MREWPYLSNEPSILYLVLVKLFYYDYKGLVDEGKIKGKWGGMVMESSKCGMRIFEFGRVLMSALIGFKKRGLSPVGEGQRRTSPCTGV